MIAALLTLGALVAIITIGLSLASARFSEASENAIEELNRLLPQTQCGQCGFPGCRPYAAAIVSGEADINQCPPGGDATILALGRLLDRPPIPANPEFGKPKPAQIASIAENICIGCGLCLKDCPVDAILGAPQFMHTVIASECTGCELCIPPCPVDCITMESK